MSAYSKIITGDEPDDEDVDVRIVMVGKTGCGKSSTGNTILDSSEAFENEFSATAVTQSCMKKTGVVAGSSGSKVSVVDTPGVLDPDLTTAETHKKLKPCIDLAAPGPHVFLVAIKLGRFTKEDKNAVNIIESAFGKKSSQYTMILFTHGDLLRGKSVEEFYKNSKELNELIKTCGGRYHVFNNNETNDRSQVTELLERINTMVLKNGGSHYTNEMFQEAQKKKAKKKIMSRVVSVLPNGSVHASLGAALGGAVGVGIEAGIMGGSVAGPVGVAVGSAVGAVVGLVVGVGLGMHQYKKNKTETDRQTDSGVK